MSDKTKQVVAGIVILCAIGAGAFWFTRPSGEIPDDRSAARPWYCYHCKKGFLLTPAEFELTIGTAVHPAEEGKAGDTTALVTVVKCPFCGGAAVAARQCKKHGEIFDPRNPDPTQRYCSQCGPDAKAPGS